MSKWKNTRFQTKLFSIFILLSIIPALLIGTTAYQKSSEMLHEQTTQDLSVILAQLNSSIERQISDFDRFSMLPYYLPDIFSFLNQPFVAPENWSTSEINAQKTMVRLMSAYPSINSSINGLMIYGMNGSINGYRLSGDLGINLAANVKEELWYKEVLAEQGGFVITGVEDVRQFTGAPFNSIIGARLLMDDNYEPLGVIAIFISPEFIPKFVRSLKLPNFQVTVLDRDRRLIYASDPKLAEQQQAIGMDQKKGSWETEVSEDNGKKTFSGVFLESNYLEWKIYMGVDRDVMLQGSRSIRNFTFIIVIAVGIAAAAVSWLLARGLSKPIYRLIRSMREVERGKFSVPVSFEREDEIGRLESSYGRMVQRLDELIYSIEEKERQKRHAELYALRARIQPHFLYNTLNSIRMLAILQQSSQIAKLIQSLNKLLHANMKLDTELVSLADEIRLLKEYAALMDLRYTNVFEMTWHIPERVKHAGVPPMLLQPLIENAIFHGAKGLERKLRIAVEARLEDAGCALEIVIRDDGSGLPDGVEQLLNQPSSDSDSDNIGLRNVQDRIRLRFGDEYGMALKRIDGQTVVKLKMPYRMLDKEADRNVESAGG
ncbi:sensor histidine kinase [Paenibacillus abyssi]|uniref:Histidine kinase n=1 Tax=Paenibacillus abyssi TaxID=1340531 RepID=A0A917FWQ8_9BACL|nr:sensor histidine kinase [Paenibacillus abyssi]GGG08326.1 histidine kinase [Paenibacillus abyssi]